MTLNDSKRAGELNYEKQSIHMSTAKSDIINMEICFPFRSKTLLEEVMKTEDAGILETYE